MRRRHLRRSAIRIPALAFALAAALTAGPVAAQDAAEKPVPSLDLRGFRPSTDAASGLYFEPARSPGTGEANVAIWLQYAARTLVLRDAQTRADVAVPVEHQLTMDLTANVGLFGRVALGADLPVALYQAGTPLDDAGRTVFGEILLPAQAVGDLALTAKATLLPPTSGDLGGFAFALHERLTLPTGDESSFLGEGHITSETRALFEYATRAWGAHAAVGIKLRGSEERFACEHLTLDETGRDPCPTRFGHELPWGLSAHVTPRLFGMDPGQKWAIFAEAFGRLPVAPIDPFAPSRTAQAEAALGTRIEVARDVSLLGAVSTSLVNGIGSPPVRATLSLGWSPRSHDADRDGIDDDVDQCRELAEDRDSFEDDDGCPEGDNDQDGVPDRADQCPTGKEDLDRFRDEDGCPEDDNDGDEVPDVSDACRNERGIASPDPTKNGCPRTDEDKDGVFGDADGCPLVPEDIDNFQDADGCPDPDNDNDGVLDAEDTCPTVPGVKSNDPRQRGCPDLDTDGDTFFGTADKCPFEREDWNDNEDEDGCPDDPTKKAIVVVAEGKAGRVLQLARGPKWTKTGEIDPSFEPVLRAIAAELLQHQGANPPWIVRAGGRGKEGPARAQILIDRIQTITRHKWMAAPATWDEVKNLPGAAPAGVGFLLDVKPSPSP